MQNNTQCIEEDTIDLRELFAVLKKRKKLVLAVTGIITIAAVVYAFFIAKPVYEVKSMIEIGKINKQPVDDIHAVKQKLSYEYQVDDRSKTRLLPKLVSISVPKGTRTILSLTVHSRNNTEGVAYIQKVVDGIKRQYQNMTDAYIGSQKELIKLTQKEIANNLSDLKKMKEKMNDYNSRIISLKRDDAALAGIYALQIGQILSQIQSLKNHISNLRAKEHALKLSITPLKVQPTHLIGNIETMDHPVKPKKKLIVIVAFITGLMLSVFLAFFLEFIEGMRKEDEVVSSE